MLSIFFFFSFPIWRRLPLHIVFLLCLLFTLSIIDFPDIVRNTFIWFVLNSCFIFIICSCFHTIFWYFGLTQVFYSSTLLIRNIYFFVNFLLSKFTTPDVIPSNHHFTSPYKFLCYYPSLIILSLF